MNGERRAFLAAALASMASPSALARTDPDMTQNTQRAIDAYAAAWTSGDLAAITQCYHDDFTLHYFGRSGLSGDHAGKARALRVLGEFSRRTRRRLLAIVATMAGETRGAIIAREQLPAARTPSRSTACSSIRSRTACCASVGSMTRIRV